MSKRNKPQSRFTVQSQNRIASPDRQAEIAELRERNAQLESLLIYATSGSKGTVSDNAALRLENDQLRRENAFFTHFLMSPELTADRPKLLSPLSGNRLREMQADDWNNALGISCTLCIRIDQENVRFISMGASLYAGSFDEFCEVIPRQIAMLINGIPTPADLRGTMPPGIDGEKLGYILRSLTYARHQNRYAQRRLELWRECWPDIEVALDSSASTMTKDRAYQAFTEACDRTMKHWDDYTENNIRVYRQWDK